MGDYNAGGSLDDSLSEKYGAATAETRLNRRNMRVPIGLSVKRSWTA
jgi:hypothetical protein